MERISRTAIKLLKVTPKGIRFPAHPLEKTKCEEQITHEHVWLCMRLGILYYHTKVKGEPHTVKGIEIRKKSQNKGFFDMILLIRGKIFVGLELKAGSGGIISPDQQRVHENHIAKGGYALFSNSVITTEDYLRKHNLI